VTKRHQAPTQIPFEFEPPAPPKAELRDLWSPDDIFAEAVRNGASVLLRFPEDNRVEWKSAKYPARDLADYLSMWANTQPYGGIIAVGIEKDGAIAGCKAAGLEKISELESLCAEQCSDAKFHTARVFAKREDGQDDFVLLFRVQYRHDKLVETSRQEAFIRVGDRKRRLTEDEKREVRINKGQIEYEREPVSLVYPDDFDDLLINDFCKQYREKRSLSPNQTREQILRLNHLGTLSGGKFLPNLACALLFALDPRLVIPGARIRFLRFEGTEEKSGRDYNVVKDVIIDGSLPRMIR
jgi:ATP-dependent DNA helicase RecG